jgi:hypothetical protein
MRLYIIIVIIVATVLAVAFVALNYRQLYATWSIQSETQRLVKLAETAPDDFQNPTSAEDRFDGQLSSFWNFSLINGGGKVSNATAWHAASYTTSNSLSIYHFPDANFDHESSDIFSPPVGQYNNVALIGGSGYQPTPKTNIVLEFAMQTGQQFYGTAGVIFQLAGTIQKDGKFIKPFDMFGVSVLGAESSVLGYNGPLCYLALNWNPVQVERLQIDSHTRHAYQIRLMWVSQTEWVGVVFVDGAQLCSISMPPLGPVEVQVWSDNYLVSYQPREHWWQMAGTMDLKFQNGGDKQFYLSQIKIYPEAKNK